jgi:hypothetical protein
MATDHGASLTGTSMKRLFLSAAFAALSACSTVSGAPQSTPMDERFRAIYKA